MNSAGGARFHFDLVCPRCGKLAEKDQGHYVPEPFLHCSDCLKQDHKAVRMKVLVARRIDPILNIYE